MAGFLVFANRGRTFCFRMSSIVAQNAIEESGSVRNEVNCVFSKIVARV